MQFNFIDKYTCSPLKNYMYTSVWGHLWSIAHSLPHLSNLHRVDDIHHSTIGLGEKKKKAEFVIVEWVLRIVG